MRAYWELVRYDLVYSVYGFERIHHDCAASRPRNPSGRGYRGEGAPGYDMGRRLVLEAGPMSPDSVATSRCANGDCRASDRFRSVPFMSHAWVEIGERVVNDLPAYRSRLMVLNRCSIFRTPAVSAFTGTGPFIEEEELTRTYEPATLIEVGKADEVILVILRRARPDGT
jgi:hypothetical protein